MTKGNLIATSFVGAIPAGVLAYFAITAFLHYSENMATMLQVVNGVTVLVSVLMALSPIAILVFMRSPAASDAARPASSAASSAVLPAAAAAAEAGSEMDVEPLGDLEGESAETADEEMSLSGFDDSPESTSAASDEAFEFDDSGFEFEDDDSK